METPLGARPPSRPPRPPSLSSQSSQQFSQEGNASQIFPPEIPVAPAGNPFRSSSNPFRSEAVQPTAQDPYLHGTINDRTY